MPIEPLSNVRVIRPGSLELTLVIDAICQRSHALVMSPNESQSTEPCSISIQAASNPIGPRKSMMSLLWSPEMTVTISPFRSFSFVLFTLIDANGSLLKSGVDLEVSPAKRQPTSQAILPFTYRIYKQIIAERSQSKEHYFLPCRPAPLNTERFVVILKF